MKGAGLKMSTEENLKGSWLVLERARGHEPSVGYVAGKEVDQRRDNSVLLLVHRDHMITVIQQDEPLLA